MSRDRFSWLGLFRWTGVAHDLRTTPIGDQGLYIDHWRGSVRIRRGDQSIVISREEIEIMAQASSPEVDLRCDMSGERPNG